MHMQTSTPLIPKAEIPAQVEEKSKIRLQLFQNNVSQCGEVGNQWDLINGPRFIDFGGSISEAHDSFFDGRKSDHGIPSNHLQLPFSTAAGSDSLIDCLRNCSISEIESSSEDITLKASIVEDADNTFGGIHLIPETKPVDNDSANKSTEHRRSTIVHPFSFEMREKEKQEHKQARLQYQMANEKLNTGGFRAKPAPKFKVPPKVTKIMPMKVRNEIVQPVAAVPPLNNNAADLVQANSSTENHVQPPSHNDFMQIESGNQMDADVQEIIAPQVKIPNAKWDDQLQPPQLSKKKPIATSQPKKPITIPRSPKLLTAQRANTWKLFEENRLRREKEQLELQKKTLALKIQREKKEIAEIRKKLVHKALPVPRNVIKRPLADPLNPISIKRRRRI